MGRAVVLKRTRAEVREAMGADIIGVLNSHAASIEDLVKALQHEVQMRMQHVQLVQDQLDAANRELIAFRNLVLPASVS